MAAASKGLPSPSSSGTCEEAPTLKPFSCLLCRQRKVKCSRTEPCQVCVRSKLQCEYVAPAPARRKSTVPPKEGLHARLQRYEHILQNYNRQQILPNPPPSQSDEAESSAGVRSRVATNPAPMEKGGKLVSRKRSSRYLDSEIWTTISKEVRDPVCLLMSL